MSDPNAVSNSDWTSLGALAIAAITFIYNFIQNQKSAHTRDVDRLAKQLEEHKVTTEQRVSGLHRSFKADIQTTRTTSYNNFTRIQADVRTAASNIAALELKMTERLALHPTKEDLAEVLEQALAPLVQDRHRYMGFMDEVMRSGILSNRTHNR